MDKLRIIIARVVVQLAAQRESALDRDRAGQVLRDRKAAESRAEKLDRFFPYRFFNFFLTKYNDNMISAWVQPLTKISFLL